jgi:hypothetical protein
MSAQSQFWNVTDPIRLGGEVNTVSEESIPVFSKDSTKLYFVRTYDADNKGGEMDQDVWQAIRVSEGTYNSCERVKSLNNKFNNAIVGINKDESVLYVLNSYDGKKDLEKGIATSRKSGDGWSSPEKVDIPTLDIEGEYYGFHVTEDESVMIISYAGPGTKGEEDLYVSQKSGGKWSAPQHMGAMVNSAGFEIGPFLNPGKDTLFFSSNGMGGEGDADIFYSVKQGSWTNWSKPVNLGSNINSPKFDAYFIHNGRQAYWSSNRDSELSDIYMVNILTPPPVAIACAGTNVSTCRTTDGSVNATVSGGVEPFTFKWTNGATTEDINGLDKGDYTVTVTDAIGQTASSSCSLTKPECPFEDLAFKHNFGYNKHKLTTKEGELNTFVTKIETQLKEGREQITIEVVSSASHVPTKTFGTNEKLAQKRAEDMAKHFKDYGAKVTVKIVEVKVDGPDYVKDSVNEEKYHPYQFVALKTK